MRRHSEISTETVAAADLLSPTATVSKIHNEVPMPRKHVLPTPIIALSPARCAAAIGADYDDVILPAILRGELGPVYRHGVKRRILVRDLEQYIRDYWPATPTQKRK
jgi:hypothetical protein